ncbi:hypothetical protein D3C81_09340 [compost metagenome]
MIVNIKYDEVQGTALKGSVNSKQVNLFMRVLVDETNIHEAITKFRECKWVVALDYVGDQEVLRDLDTAGVVVLIKKEIDKLDMNVDFIMKSIPNNIRVVFKLPETYCDMQSIVSFSKRYENIRFCGGNFIRLEEAKLGCIGVEDIFKKVAESRIPLVSQGCACIFNYVNLEDVTNLEFYEDRGNASSTKVVKERKSSPRKVLSSLVALDKKGGFDNF